MNNYYHKHYLNLKKEYDPQGEDWGWAIKEYCQEYDVNEKKLRSYIATNIGGNKNRVKKRLSFSEIDKLLEQDLTKKSISELEDLLFNLKFAYVEPTMQVASGLDQRKFEMGEWAVKAVEECEDYKTQNKIKGKYHAEIAYYLNNQDYKPNKALQKLNSKRAQLELIIQYKQAEMDLSPLF